MAEEDEIDVLGDFDIDNFMSKSDTCLSLGSDNSEFLNCDYTIHPQWLLDKPSANPDNWYGTEVTQSDQTDSMGHVSTENCITDESGWTEKEKNLLDRGIEIFGKSNVRLSQFIGSKTASEVKYYLKNFYSENQPTCRSYSECLLDDNNLVSDILDDTQIPASIEEVIAAVSTAKPTVPLNSKKVRKKSNSFSDVDINNIAGGQSILKTNYTSPKSPKGYKQRKNENTITTKRKLKIQNNKPAKFKFKTKLKMPNRITNTRIPSKITSLKTMNVNVLKEKSVKQEFRKVEITTGKGLAVPICEGEEIIKLKKVEDESDEDVDVDIDIEDTDEQVPKCALNDIKTDLKIEVKEEPDCKQVEFESKEPSIYSKVSPNDLHTNQFVDLSVFHEDTVKELMSMDEPKEEIHLKDNVITELEKAIHPEFFEGRQIKTPERYLKIRNHILSAWEHSKPMYVKKTTIRQGLKSCGDVNSIGRVHYFLEQIGAINFGCDQVVYSRPLYDMLQSLPNKPKTVKETAKGLRNVDLGQRPRVKRKFVNDGEGGCTLAHDENGEIINTTIVNEDPVQKQRLYIKKPLVRLIYCRPFTDDKPQEYTINLQLAALLKMDFHAHTNLSEVMGLVAGYWNPHTKTLTVTHYETCKNMASSSTHCDMCPISQADAADKIHSQGLDILGWFHSHPTFAPEPSHQDLETQQTLQQWIGHQKPCIGIILSPFSLNGALIASPYRCMIVDKKINFEDQFVPYKFKVNLLSEDFHIEDFLRELRKVVMVAKSIKSESSVVMDRPYFQDKSLTYLDKFIYSVRMHLAKCGNFSKATCDNIIQGITDVIMK